MTTRCWRFERHATSKLRTANDLLSIATLGFRGEALPTIAAVSRLVLETRTAEEEQGTRIEFGAGKLFGVKPAGVPAGTSISVSDLFYSVPARRKFLKSETTELGHIASLVTHYALANPDRQFVLKTPTQEILNVSAAAVRAEAPAQESVDGAEKPQQGIAGLAERVYQLFGRQALEELFEIPPTSAPVRAAMTEPALEEAERDFGSDDFRICFAAAGAAAESKWDLCFREPAIGARSSSAACNQRSVPKYFAAFCVSGGVAVCGFAARRSGCECTSIEN